MRAFILAVCLIVSCAANAVIEVHQFDDPAKKQLYEELIAELRCLVCQNQNLAASTADLARDLRQETYEMVEKGASEQDVLDYMVARYGDFVLYRPPVKSTTLLLWAGPIVLLLAGLVIVVVVARRRAATTGELDDEERREARRLLED